MKRFDDVVIGPIVEAPNAIFGGVASRQYQHGYMPPLPTQLLQVSDAIAIWQHKVQNDDIVGNNGKCRFCLSKI